MLKIVKLLFIQNVDPCWMETFEKIKTWEAIVFIQAELRGEGEGRVEMKARGCTTEFDCLVGTFSDLEIIFYLLQCKKILKSTQILSSSHIQGMLSCNLSCLLLIGLWQKY